MKYLVQIASVLIPVLCFGVEKERIHPKLPDVRINLESPDYMKDLGYGRLKVWVIAGESRSEGLHGELEGLEDPSDRVSTIETQEGKLVYRGDWEERPFLWSASGWLPKDLDAPLIREVNIEYSLSPLELATAVEKTLKTVVESQDKQIEYGEEEHKITYNYGFKEGVIIFTIVECKSVISSTVTAYEVRYAELRSKWERPKDRSELTIRSFTKRERTAIEELDLLHYRQKQMQEGIDSTHPVDLSTRAEATACDAGMPKKYKRMTEASSKLLGFGEAIIVPSFIVDEKKFTRVIEDLSEVTTTYSPHMASYNPPSRIGLSIIPIMNPRKSNPLISIQAENMNFFELLDAICIEAGPGYFWSATDAVVIFIETDVALEPIDPFEGPKAESTADGSE